MKVPASLSAVPTEIVKDIRGGDQFPRTVPFDIGKQRHTCPIIADPSLCVTPEKGDLKKSFERLKGDSDENKRTNGTNSQRVRFDHTVEVCELSPQDVQGVLKRTTNDNAEDETERKTYSYSVNDEDYVSDDNADYSANLHSSLPKIEGFSKLTAVESDCKKQERTFDLHGLSQLGRISALPSVCAQPELNTTLKVSMGMKLLREAEYDPIQLVTEKLSISSKTKQQIEEKVSQKLNIQEDMFGQLPSIDVNEDEVVNPVIKKGSAATRFSGSSVEGKQDGDGPDLMEFFTHDLQREPFSLTMEGLAEQEASLCIAPLSCAFDVYRHLRSWNNL